MDIKQLASSFIGTVIRLVILAFAIFAIYKAGLTAYDFGYRIFTEEPMSAPPGREVSITVVQGDSLMDVCNIMEEKGLVRDAKLAYVQKKVSVYGDDIEPGFYTLNTSMTAEEMYGVLAGVESEEEEGIEGEGEDGEIAEPLPLEEISTDSLIEEEYEGTEDVFGTNGEEVVMDDGTGETEGDVEGDAAVSIEIE